MTATPEQQSGGETGPRGFSGWQVAGIVGLAVVATAGLGFWLLSQYVFVDEFAPVELAASEERALDGKLRALGVDVREPGSPEPPPPARYSESGAIRAVRLSERELNAMLARDPDLARRVSVDMAQDLLSVLVLVPVDEGFPVLGGRTLRVHAGVELAFEGGRPLVKLRGVSIMGVPLPNAWLGDLKNVDLVREFGGEPGFWQSFAEGVANIRVEEGELLIELRE